MYLNWLVTRHWTWQCVNYWVTHSFDPVRQEQETCTANDEPYQQRVTSHSQFERYHRKSHRAARPSSELRRYNLFIFHEECPVTVRTIVVPKQIFTILITVLMHACCPRIVLISGNHVMNENKRGGGQRWQWVFWWMCWSWHVRGNKSVGDDKLSDSVSITCKSLESLTLLIKII